MKPGCLFALILLPITILIWAKNERRRRAAMPPEQRKALKDEEQFGEINPAIECIYCHETGCVRMKVEILYEDGTDIHTPEGIALLLTSTTRYGSPQTDEHILAHCMNCGSHWNKFIEEKS